MVLYDDPAKGYPKTYARANIPKMERYPNGQNIPAPKELDFKPGQLLDCISGELGLRGITVTEITFCNSIGVAERVVMILQVPVCQLKLAMRQACAKY